MNLDPVPNRTEQEIRGLVHNVHKEQKLYPVILSKAERRKERGRSRRTPRMLQVTMQHQGGLTS